MGGNTSEVWCVIFVSTIVKDLTDQQVEEILKESRERRLQKGLSGLTILADLNTLIFIEGDKESVQKQFENARKLQGHFNLIKVYDEQIPHRFFEDSPLAFRVLGSNKFKHLDDFRSPEKKEYFDELVAYDHKVARILGDFIRHNT